MTAERGDVFPKGADVQLAVLVGLNAAVIVAVMVLVGRPFMTPCNIQSLGTQMPELSRPVLDVMLAMVSGNSRTALSGLALANLPGVVTFLLLLVLVLVLALLVVAPTGRKPPTSSAAARLRSSWAASKRAAHGVRDHDADHCHPGDPAGIYAPRRMTRGTAL